MQGVFLRKALMEKERKEKLKRTNQRQVHRMKMKKDGRVSFVVSRSRRANLKKNGFAALVVEDGHTCCARLLKSHKLTFVKTV